METIIVKERNMDGFWIEITKDNGRAEREHLRGARAGLSWPSPRSPAYYVILGQLSKTLPNGRHPLWVLREGFNHIINDLFQEAVDVMGEFVAHEVFSDISSKYQNYVLNFWQFHQERKLQEIRLLPAPFFQSFNHGVFLVKEWIKNEALHIPEGTLVREQLRNIREDDLKVDPEAEFFAINALRHSLAAFDVSDYLPPRRKISPSKAPPWGAWY
jgi:hypothetical protein